MCGATEGGLSLDGVNVAKEAIIQGQVLRDGEPAQLVCVGPSGPVGVFFMEKGYPQGVAADADQPQAAEEGIRRLGSFAADVPVRADRRRHVRFFGI